MTFIYITVGFRLGTYVGTSPDAWLEMGLNYKKIFVKDAQYILYGLWARYFLSIPNRKSEYVRNSLYFMEMRLFSK